MEKNVALLAEVQRQLEQGALHAFRFLIVGHGSEEAWLRGKERLKGDPIDWGKTIDPQYLHRAIGAK